MVTKQNLVFDCPVTSCPTLDNIFVEITVSVVLNVNPEHDYVYQLCLNVSELNQILVSAISERVRILARSLHSKKIYDVSGEKHAAPMLEHLKSTMATKGINIKSVIITKVKLPDDVASSLQDRTVYQFKNTLERKKQAFELRTINDKESIEGLRLARKLERE
jgi:regulator of protease activity HflC (stomatin/prohibitin superfamily)